MLHNIMYNYYYISGNCWSITAIMKCRPGDVGSIAPDRLPKLVGQYVAETGSTPVRASRHKTTKRRHHGPTENCIYSQYPCQFTTYLRRIYDARLLNTPRSPIPHSNLHSKREQQPCPSRRIGVSGPRSLSRELPRSPNPGRLYFTQRRRS